MKTVHREVLFETIDHTSATAESLSEDPNFPQMKHWCRLYLQFLQKKLHMALKI